MLAIEVGPVDVARTRYAISPLGEAMQALRVAAGVQAAGALRPWAEPAARPGTSNYAGRCPQSGR
ncbi:hypothetical protein [Streptomyces pristinaespiralis]|uniref:hypothetical protein n=1 Tax=Streptomyces pristinaespiralis TaxID=38300 RepID=UPI003838B8A4